MRNSSDEPERELFPLSWLSQYGYCPRRCGLLAIDQLWEESADTASGRAQHDRVHTARIERRGARLSLFELSVFSRSLGVSGKCDCVEADLSDSGVPLPYGAGKYTLYPVECKHGVVRDETEYQVQLCAQAICLEEQFGAGIPAGAIFYIGAHRRDEVLFTPELRALTYQIAASVMDMLTSATVPPAVYSAKCRKCSLLDSCSPKLKSSARSYCQSVWSAAAEGHEI